LKFSELVRLLEGHGFELIKEKGSVRYYGKEGLNKLIRLDYHGSREIPKGTCDAILKAAGLKGKIGLYGSGFLTDGILDALGVEAEGLETTLHYGDGIETPKSKTFRLNYAKAYKVQPDVHAVQGYDAGLLLAAGLKAVKGDMSKRKELIAALENAKIDSPRGAWTMSKAHNPIQDIYLRKVVGKKNTVMGVAHKALADPARGCKMG